jgi:predicted ATPase
MLTKIRIQNFKQFDDVEIELGPVTVLIGPNNSGKTTVLQALMLWYTAFQKFSEIQEDKLLPWEKQLKSEYIDMGRLAFIGIPTTESLWINSDVDLNKPVPDAVWIRIKLFGSEDNGKSSWDLLYGFLYPKPDSMLCMSDKIPPSVRISPFALLTPMSKILSTEERFHNRSVESVIKEGRSSEIIRNMLYRVYENHKYWEKVYSYMKRIFGIEILPPELSSRDEIIYVYYHTANGIKFEIASAGRGMLHILLILAYMYNNPGNILLLDEPDAHLEILRQRELYRVITEVAHELNSQIIIATHSEVIMNEAGENDVLIACVGKPHRIDEKGKSQVLKALKEIGFDQYYQAIQRQWVLYLEGSTDLSVLHTFARTLGHDAAQALERPFVHYVGNVVDHAANHFYALREAQETLKGITILDRPATSDQSKKAAKKQNTTGPLRVLYWQRNEIENYLSQPETLLAYARSLNHPDAESTMQEVIRGRIPPFALQDKEDIWWRNTKMSDDFLVPLFKDFFNRLGQYNAMDKASFYILAYHVPAELIDPEVIEKLDAIWDIAKDAPNT